MFEKIYSARETRRFDRIPSFNGTEYQVLFKSFECFVLHTLLVRNPRGVISLYIS
jgi:hypothetical protein